MDFIFSTACYIAAILFVCWLRHTPTQPQAIPTATQAEQEASTPAHQPEPEIPAIPDPWETPATTSVRRWVSRHPQAVTPVLALCPAKEEVKAVTKPQPTQFDLNALDAVTLRKLCTQHGIAWKGVRGKNRHATKAMMIFQLSQKAVA